MTTKKSFLITLLAAIISTYTHQVSAGDIKIQAIVVEKFGHIEIQRAGESTWKRVYVRTKIHTGDTIKTGEKSNVYIRFLDNTVQNLRFEGSTLRVDENTTLTIKESHFENINEEKSKIRLSLQSGDMMSVVPKNFKQRFTEKNAVFEVETPVAVCGVRGTVFRSIHTPANGSSQTALSSFGAYEGDIAVRSKIEPSQQVIHGAPGQWINIRGITRGAAGRRAAPIRHIQVSNAPPPRANRVFKKAKRQLKKFSKGRTRMHQILKPGGNIKPPPQHILRPPPKLHPPPPSINSTP